MSESDHLLLDGRLLRLLVMIHEEKSVTKVAGLLGQNQSSVSHGLERLRRITGDPLFVRSGRGIVATRRADELVESARHLLTELKTFTETEDYDPQTDNGEFRIGANDYETETILRPLLRLLRRRAPGLTMQIHRVYSRQDWTSLLRNDEIDLVLAPTLSSGEADLVQQTLFRDSHVCVFDINERSAPATLDAYCAAPHAAMLPGRFGPTDIDRQLTQSDRRRQVVVSAPSFAMLAAVMHGTDIVATMPSRLAENLFSRFETCAPPVETPTFSIAQVWHRRSSVSPRHVWFRECIRAIAQARDG